MGKHKKHKQTGRQGQDMAGLGAGEWQTGVETLLASGQTRAAVEAAKLFLKQAPGPEAEALLVRAYQARIQALLANGMHKEAQALGALVSERFPGYRAQIAPLLRQSEVSDGNFQTLLTELSTADGQRRRELEVTLMRKLTDPAVLTDSPALPADHPLKRAGRAVCDLFTAVTTGPLPEGALAPLDMIPRHSPLAPWKLLVRALDAFYRRADAAVLANLAGIPLDSGPGRLVPVLRRLVGEKGLTEDRSFAVATLLDKVSGGRALLQSRLPQLSQALAMKDERKALVAVQELLPLFQSAPAALRRSFLATVLHHWYRQELSPQGLLRVLPRGKKDPDTLRLVALTLERTQWDAALDWWNGYLTAAAAAGTLPTTGPELARVLLHMAALFPADPDEVLDILGVEHEKELQKLIRTGELPAFFDRAALLERARAADPDPLVFRALVAHYDQRDPKRAEVEAEAWRRAHPQDLEPLLYLTRAAERRNALRKALDLLAAAESLNRVHPEVRQSRFRLLLASAERRLKEGKPALAAADLDLLEQEPRAGEGDHKVYLLALRWAVAHKAAAPVTATQCTQALAASVNNPALADLTLGTVAGTLGIKPPPQSDPPTQLQAIDGLARACDLFHALDRPLTVPAALLTQVEQDLASTTATQLHSLCAGGLWLGRPALTYAASGQGLTQDGPLVHRFLLSRGQALRATMTQREQERARQCLRAARELAGRARDMEVVREASAALDSVPDWGAFDVLLQGVLTPPAETPPTQEEIARTITAERRSRTVPRFMVQKAPRKPRKATPPRQRLPRGLLNEMFSFLFEGKL
jgi:hypothetical protein